MFAPNFIVAAFKTFFNIFKTRHMALLKGLKLTLRSMGPNYVAKEIIRHIAGIPYSYNGILIKGRRYIPPNKVPCFQGLCVEARRLGVFPQ